LFGESTAEFYHINGTELSRIKSAKQPFQDEFIIINKPSKEELELYKLLREKIHKVFAKNDDNIIKLYILSSLGLLYSFDISYLLSS